MSDVEDDFMCEDEEDYGLVRIKHREMSKLRKSIFTL
jgi:hypothetical protein